MPAPVRSGGARILLYSHDTYGLGHARRSLLLAESIAALPDVRAILVATGSPRAQSFPLGPGIDTLKLPAATKGPEGVYRARTLGLDLDDLIALRSRLLDAAFRSFEPDLVLVDHAPVGMAGELWPTLRRCAGEKDRPRLVLGLRDIVDDVKRVRSEWAKLGVWPALDRLYDRVLVYGDSAIETTARELDLDHRLHGKVRHVGYLARTAPRQPPTEDDLPLIVVTVGGGGDGLPLLDAFADFLTSGTGRPCFRSTVLTGPLLSDRRRTAVAERLRASGAEVEIHEFVPDPERLFASAAGVVSMAGYNTTCELMAAGVPTLLVPREAPRAEQLLRARRLAETGAVTFTNVCELTSALGPFIDTALARPQRRLPVVALDGVRRATAEIADLLAEGHPKVVSVTQARGRRAPLRVGYVLKKFPRLSETFILTELLALNASGVDISVMSTRKPDDEPRHAALDRLPASVMQLVRRPSDDWPSLLTELRRRTHPGAATIAEGFLTRLPAAARASVLGQSLQVVGQVEQRSLRHLHAHFLSVAAHIAYVSHLICGVSFSVTVHAKDVYRHSVDRDVFAEVAGAASALVTVCEANRRHIVEHLLGGQPANIQVVYNGVPADTVTAGPTERDRSLVLAVGRLVEKKGFDVLVDAFRILRDADNHVRCIIVGEGDQRERLTALIAEADLADSVRLAGPLPSERVLELMRQAGVLAVPCVTGADGNRDALPTVVLEAMASGLPVVATPVGGIAEMVRDGVEGRLVYERDPSALAKALSDVLADTESWEAMSRAGKRTVSERFDSRAAAARLIEIFTSVDLRAAEAALERVV
jgi:predicted glycosyltransferase/glycosyltransferase involved in cell wall biosynthesis